MRKTIAVLMLAVLLAACGGSPTPGAATPAPGVTRPGSATTAPAAAPTLALTPPGIPAGGFPLLTTALDGTIVYNNGDGDIYQVQPRPGATPQRVIAAADNKGFLQEPIWSPDGKRIAYTYLLPFDTSGLSRAGYPGRQCRWEQPADGRRAPGGRRSVHLAGLLAG